MTSLAAPSVARLTTPGEIAAVVPQLCRFVPAESLVLVALRGPRRRAGLTVRMDLAPLRAAPELVEPLLDRLWTDAPTGVVLTVWTQQPDRGGGLAGRVAADLVERVVASCARRGAAVTEALLVRAGRWWSYTCAGRCCPPDGTPLPGPDGSPALRQVAAEAVLDGRVVAADREELARPVAGPTRLAAREVEQHLHAALGRLAGSPGGPAAVRAAAVADWAAALDAVAERAAPPPPAGAADLVVSLADVRVRDEVLTWVPDRDEEMLQLLLHLAGRCLPPYDAAVGTMLALTAWCRGDGALANVALDRALADDPGYRLAVLVRAGLDGAVPPRQVRAWLRATGRSLRRTTRRRGRAAG